MAFSDFPDDLTAENILSWQGRLEDRLEKQLEVNTEKMLIEVRNRALAFSLTAAGASVLWEKTVETTLKDCGFTDDDLRSSVARDLAESLLSLDLGSEAFQTVQEVGRLYTASREPLTAADREQALTEALGLDTGSLVAAGSPRKWVSKLLEKIKPKGSPWKTRLKRQVRTSFTGITGRLTLRELRRRGIRYKQWVTRKDDAVRDTHRAADGDVVPTESPFRVGTEFLMYPGEPGKSLNETANCRCIIVPASGPM